MEIEAVNTSASQVAPVRAAATYVAILLGSYGADYLGNVMFGRWLGHAHYGDYGVAVSLALLLAEFANLGTDESVPRFLPAYLAEKRYDRVRGFLRSHLLAIAAVTPLLALAAVGGFRLFSAGASLHPAAGIWWIVPVLAVANFLYRLLSNHERTMTAANLLQMTAAPLLVLGAAALWLYTGGSLSSEHAVAAYGMAFLALLPVYWNTLKRKFPAQIWSARPAYDIPTWAKTAAPMILTTLIYYTLGQADLYVMEHVGDEKDVGIFLACTKTADFVFLSYTAALMVISPRISPLAAGGRLKELGSLIRQFMRVIAALSLAAAAVLIVFGRQILGLFGAGFDAGYPALALMACANVAVSMLSIAWPLLSYSGHERLPIPALALALVSLVITAEIFIPLFGLMGAAVCKSMVMILLFAHLARQVNRRLGIRLWRL